MPDSMTPPGEEMKLVERCGCRDVAMRSYDGAVLLVQPWDREDGRVGVTVDACLALEVYRLWKAGIRTTGCCCGHNVAPSYIGVVPEHIEQMKAMGYEVQHNPCRPGDEDSFIPKSIPSADLIEQLVGDRDRAVGALDEATRAMIAVRAAWDHLPAKPDYATIWANNSMMPAVVANNAALRKARAFLDSLDQSKGHHDR